MHALLNVAVMAARRAGTALIKKMATLDRIKVEQKGFNDYVSEADLAAERQARILTQKYQRYAQGDRLARHRGIQGQLGGAV